MCDISICFGIILVRCMHCVRIKFGLDIWANYLFSNNFMMGFMYILILMNRNIWAEFKYSFEPLFNYYASLESIMINFG
jgi:hypothetical protein